CNPRSRCSSMLPVPLNSSKINSSIRLPVSVKAVASTVRLPPSSAFRAEPKNFFGLMSAFASTPPDMIRPLPGSKLLYPRESRVRLSSKTTHRVLIPPGVSRAPAPSRLPAHVVARFRQSSNDKSRNQFPAPNPSLLPGARLREAGWRQSPEDLREWLWRLPLAGLCWQLAVAPRYGRGDRVIVASAIPPSAR